MLTTGFEGEHGMKSGMFGHKIWFENCVGVVIP